MTINASKDNRRGRRYLVKLNGVTRPNAFYADGRRRLVREYEIPLRVVDGSIPTRTLRGKVTWVRLEAGSTWRGIA